MQEGGDEKWSKLGSDWPTEGHTLPSPEQGPSLSPPVVAMAWVRARSSQIFQEKLESWICMWQLIQIKNSVVGSTLHSVREHWRLSKEAGLCQSTVGAWEDETKKKWRQDAEDKPVPPVVLLRHSSALLSLSSGPGGSGCISLRNSPVGAHRHSWNVGFRSP